MSDFLSQVREALKEIVTADNAEAMAKISAKIDEAEQSFDKIAQENTSLKDKIVDMVKGTISSKEAPKDENSPEAPKTVDELLEGAINDVITKRK